MPRLPRDVKGLDLAHALSRVGYSIDRQSGSHVRLTAHDAQGDHHVTIPAHASLKPGTLNHILGEVAARLGMEKDLLLHRLFD